MTPHRGESGVALIELLIAIVVLSIGVLSVIGALGVGINSGRVQRELSAGELTLRSFAEYVKGQAYVECAVAADYGAGFSASSDSLGGSMEPADRALPGAGSTIVSYTSTVLDVYHVKADAGDDGRLVYKDDDSADEDDFDQACGGADPDEGLQLVMLRVVLDSAANDDPLDAVLETTVSKWNR